MCLFCCKKGSEFYRLRKVFLDDLQKWEIGGNKGRINWEKNIGRIVNFIFDDVEDFFTIVDYDKSNNKVTINYKIKIYIKTTKQIKENNICTMVTSIKYSRSNYRYSIGEIIGDKIKILEQTHQVDKNHVRKAYKCECLKCHGNFIRIEYGIESKECPICSDHPKQVIIGINDMWTTNPELAKLLANSEDGYKYTQCCNTKVDWKCPICNTIIKNKHISTVKRRGIGCPCCGDGISFSEKAFYALCIQLKELNLIESFETQYSPDWANNRRYDFKIVGFKNHNSIIETNGIQHYEKNGEFKRTLQEEQENDKYKEELAKQNTDYPYVVLDVRESTIEWFKNAIINSILTDYYSFTEDMIDWDRIYEHTLTSLKKQVWDLWNSGEHDTSKISIICNVGKGTIVNYLKDGVKFNKCNYSKVVTREVGSEKLSDLYSKKVICITTGMIFNSLKEATKYAGLSSLSCICQCCNGNSKSAGKLLNGTRLQWMYYDVFLESENIKNEYNDPRCKKVFCLTTGKLFNSTKEASQYYNINSISSIPRCCIGGRPTCGKLEDGTKLRWIYYDKYLELIEKEGVV